jgi:hypothetical protein
MFGKSARKKAKIPGQKAGNGFPQYPYNVNITRFLAYVILAYVILEERRNKVNAWCHQRIKPWTRRTSSRAN